MNKNAIPFFENLLRNFNKYANILFISTNYFLFFHFPLAFLAFMREYFSKASYLYALLFLRAFCFYGLSLTVVLCYDNVLFEFQICEG